MRELSERLIAYGWYCDGNEIKGHYIATENHKLYYNINGDFIKKERK